MKEAEAFSQFHESLKLNREEVNFARGFPDEVREALRDGDISITHSFLQGSLARRTMISPLKDVDMVVSLDRDRYSYMLSDREGPDWAMTLLESGLEVLRRRYPSLRFGPRKRHALPIMLGSGYPSFDLVPAFETQTRHNDDVLIADRDRKRWKRSNPRKLGRVVAAANQAAGGKLIHVVRMVKHAVRNNLHQGFPGLAVESFAVDAMRSPVTYAEGSALVFVNGSTMLGGPILDPTGVDDLAAKIDGIEPGFTQQAKEWFQDQAADARRARQCAESGEHNKSISWWYRIFGHPFPSPPHTQSRRMAAVGLTTAPRAPRPTRAWRNFN